MSSGKPPSGAVNGLGSSRPPPPNAPSAEALRILAAAADEIFTVPNTQKFDRDNRDAFQQQIAESTSPFADLDHHRLIHILDALASLLVSQYRSEVVAVGYVPTDDDRVALCIGENGSLDHLAAAENHLRDMWGILQEIRGITGRTNCEKTPEESDLPADPTSSLYQICYTFSRDRIKRYYTKATENNMLDGLINALAAKKAQEGRKPNLVPSSPGKKPCIMPKNKPAAVLSDVQWQLVETLKDVIEKYADYAYHGGKAKPWMMACSRANDLARMLNNRLNFLDELLWQDAPGPQQRSSGDRYQRIAEKLLVVDASVQQLLILPRSASFGKALDRPILDIRHAPSEVGHLTYDFTKDDLVLNLVNKKRSIKSAEFISCLSTRDNYRVRRTAWAQNVHAECAVLAYFTEQRVLAYNYIGVSHLSCVGCWLFFEAYNEVADDLNLNHYYTRGSHTKVYPWVPPQMTSQKAILIVMKPRAEDFFNKLVPRDRLMPHTLWVSSAASVSANRASMDWEQTGDLDIPAPS